MGHQYTLRVTNRMHERVLEEMEMRYLPDANEIIRLALSEWLLNEVRKRSPEMQRQGIE